MDDIFGKDEFTLKEFCNYFINNINKIRYSDKLKIHEDILHVCKCYMYFSSNNKNYIKYLQKARVCPCYIYINNKKKLSIREILQVYDFDFCKLIVRISVNTHDNNIKVKWQDLYNRFKNISKEELEDLIKLR